MNRSEIIEKLGSLRFCIFWPPAEWKDIGFTERPIWVNSEGYGYIGEDDYSEPCSCMRIDGIPEEQLFDIKRKIDDGTITIEDIKATSLIKLNELYDDIEELFLEQLLKNNLETLPSTPADDLYCEKTIDGWIFFTSEESLIAYNEDEFCNYYGYGETWKSMSDLQLEIWYERIFIEDRDMILPIMKGIIKDKLYENTCYFCN